MDGVAARINKPDVEPPAVLHRIRESVEEAIVIDPKEDYAHFLSVLARLGAAIARLPPDEVARSCSTCLRVMKLSFIENIPDSWRPYLLILLRRLSLDAVQAKASVRIHEDWTRQAESTFKLAFYQDVAAPVSPRQAHRNVDTDLGTDLLANHGANTSNRERSDAKKGASKRFKLKKRSPKPNVTSADILEDVPAGHSACRKVKYLRKAGEVVGTFFSLELTNGEQLCFKTRVKSAGGSVEHASRIARLCWAKFEKGATWDQVVGYRKAWYERVKNINKNVIESKELHTRLEGAAQVALPIPAHLRAMLTGSAQSVLQQDRVDVSEYLTKVVTVVGIAVGDARRRVKGLRDEHSATAEAFKSFDLLVDGSEGTSRMNILALQRRLRCLGADASLTASMPGVLGQPAAARMPCDQTAVESARKLFAGGIAALERQIAMLSAEAKGINAVLVILTGSPGDIREANLDAQSSNPPVPTRS